MSALAFEHLTVSAEQLGVLVALLESEHAKLLIEIRHTDHRLFRDELRHRLSTVEELLARCGRKMEPGAEAHPGS